MTYILVDGAISCLLALNWNAHLKTRFNTGYQLGKNPRSTLDFNSGLTELYCHLLLYFEYVLKSGHSAVSQLTAQINHFTLSSSISYLTHSFGIKYFRTQTEWSSNTTIQSLSFLCFLGPPVECLHWMFRICIIIILLNSLSIMCTNTQHLLSIYVAVPWRLGTLRTVRWLELNYLGVPSPWIILLWNSHLQAAKGKRQREKKQLLPV